MPLLRYFLFVGGTLLALLLISDAVLPKLPMPAGPAAADLTTIRIHTDRKWPARVVFDTSLPPAAQTQTAQAAPLPMPKPQAAATGTDPSAAARQAFAQMTGSSSPPMPIASAPGAVKAEAKARPSRKMARKTTAHPMVLVAQHPPYGFFW